MNASVIILTNVSFKDGIEVEMKWVVVTTGWVWDCGLHWCLPMRISNRKIFGLHPKVNFPQPIYAFTFVVIMLVGPTKVSIMKLKCTVLNRMWQHDLIMNQIFFSSIFLSKNTVRLDRQAGYSRHDPWYTRYQTCLENKFVHSTTVLIPFVGMSRN